MDSLKLRAEKNRQDMKQQIIVFVLTLFLTIVAFAAVMLQDVISIWFVVPFIIILAVIQVLFQLFYFMHLNQKGHEAPKFFIFYGIFAAVMVVVGVVTISWL